MKKNLLFILSILLLTASCKTLQSSKVAEYNKQIEGDLNVYIAYISTKEKDNLFENMKRHLVEKFSQRGIKAEVTILKIEDTNSVLDKKNMTANNSNGLTLVIHEAEFSTYTKGNYQNSKIEVTLTDHLLDRDVWKTGARVDYMNVLGGVNKAAGLYTSAILRTLEKDGLLKKN